MILSSYLSAKADQDKWLPLSQHLEDTKNVMEQLLEHFVAPSVYEASGIEYDFFRRVALFVSYTHDIGKATSAFQIKMCNAISGYRTLITKKGFSATINGLEEKSPHALAGAAILNSFFGIDESICEIIASHHGKPVDNGKENIFNYQTEMLIDNYYSSTSCDAYKNTWKEIINRANNIANVSDIKDIPITAKMLITGLLIMADWIASCEEFFPLLGINERYVSIERATKGMAALKLQPYHDFDLASMDPELFMKRFGFMPNELQNMVFEISNSIASPGIMIIEAPMGMGKTEAALAAAEIESCAAGTGGIFFGLPTRGTADAMFDRVKDWAGILSQKTSSSINLSHSSAEFNDSYNALRTKIYDEDKYGVSVNSWMTGRYKKLLPDFTIGTIDQALFTALKRKFLMLLHLGIAGKTVIIDEVHSYDDYMTEYMKVLLSWLGAYKVPVILLSATLTKEKRDELIHSYTGKKDFEKTDAYPAVIWSDGEEVHSLPVKTQGMKRVAVHLKYARKTDTGEILKNLLCFGGCAGVVCDTVSHAQAAFEQLEDQLPSDYTIILLHSRFLPEDRAAIEKRIMELVGKKSKKRDKIVVVGTQVLEQSLDFDFDVLFTEKCPIDLLFQRLGRLHRHLRDNRPDKVKVPVCYIYCDEDSRKGAKIYEDYIIRRTDESLPQDRIIYFPDDIRKLTEEVYDIDKGSEGFDKQEYLNHREELKRLSKAYLLPTVEKCKFRGMLTVENSGKNDASVRYGINSVELILLRKKEHDYETFSGFVVECGKIPDNEQAKELLKNRISLRYDDELMADEKDREYIFNDDIRLWKRNYYLEDEHFLIADEDGLFTIGKHLYSYTNTRGWRKEE